MSNNLQIKSYKLILIGSVFIFFFFLFTSHLAYAACADVPMGGSYTVSSSCTFANTVDGVDNGGITVDAGQTLTVNAGQTITWSPGSSLVINGSIAIANGAQLKQTYLWVTDADNDGYPASTTMVAQDATPTGGKRRSAITAFTYATDATGVNAMKLDYDETNASVYPGTTCNGDCSVNDDNGNCVAKAAGENGLPACQRCDGSSLTHVNVTDNTQDAEGSTVCNATCKKCSSGSCINQTSGEDLFSQCTGAYSCSGYAVRLRNVCNGSGACAAIDSAATDCSGTCSSYCSSGSCISTDSGAGTCTIATNAYVGTGGDGSCSSNTCTGASPTTCAEACAFYCHSAFTGCSMPRMGCGVNLPLSPCGAPEDQQLFECEPDYCCCAGS